MCISFPSLLQHPPYPTPTHNTHSHTHPLTPPSQRWLVATATVSPLFLMLLWDSDRQTWAEWQCVCGSGKRPTTTNKRRSRQTLPNLGSGDLGVIVWVGRSLPRRTRRSLLTLFFHFLSNCLNEKMCQSLSAKWLWEFLIITSPQERKILVIQGEMIVMRY